MSRTRRTANSVPSGPVNHSSNPRERRVSTHDALTGAELFHARVGGQYSPAGVYADDGTTFVHTDDEQLVVREASSGRERCRWPHGAGSIEIAHLAASPTGNRLAAYVRDGRLRVWDTRDGKLQWESQPGGDAGQIAFHPSGKFLATGGPGGIVKVWNAQTGQEWMVLRGHTQIVVRALAFRADGNRLATTAPDGETKVWDTTAIADRAFPGTLVNKNPLAHPNWTIVSLSRDGKYLAAANGIVTVWETETGRKVRSFQPPLANLSDVVLSPDGSRVAISVQYPEVKQFGVRIVSVSTGEEVSTCRGLRSFSRSMTFTPDGRLLAANDWGSDNAAAVAIWDAATGREVRSLVAPGGPLAFSPDGRRLAELNIRGDAVPRGWAAVGVRSTDTWDRVWTGPPAMGAAYCLAYSPDGSRLAVGTGDGTVWILDALTGEERQRLRGVGSHVAAAFHPDGRRLATLANLGSVGVWDLATGREILTIGGTPTSASNIVFSPDGRKLYRGTAEGNVEVLDATPWPELAKRGR